MKTRSLLACLLVFAAAGQAADLKTIDGAEYKNIVIKAATPYTINIVHDTGLAELHLAAVPDSELQRLYTSPEWTQYKLGVPDRETDPRFWWERQYFILAAVRAQAVDEATAKALLAELEPKSALIAACQAAIDAQAKEQAKLAAAAKEQQRELAVQRRQKELDDHARAEERLAQFQALQSIDWGALREEAAREVLRKQYEAR